MPEPESTRPHIKGPGVDSNTNKALLGSIPEVPAESLSNDPDIKTFPQSYNADSGHLPIDTSPLQQFEFVHPANPSILPPCSQNPQFGFEAFISNFPQELDDYHE